MNGWEDIGEEIFEKDVERGVLILDVIWVWVCFDDGEELVGRGGGFFECCLVVCKLLIFVICF